MPKPIPVNAPNLNMDSIIERAHELEDDFGRQPAAFWIKLANEGYELDHREFMALGYLMTISKK